MGGGDYGRFRVLPRTLTHQVPPRGGSRLSRYMMVPLRHFRVPLNPAFVLHFACPERSAAGDVRNDGPVSPAAFLLLWGCTWRFLYSTALCTHLLRSCLLRACGRSGALPRKIPGILWNRVYLGYWRALVMTEFPERDLLAARYAIEQTPAVVNHVVTLPPLVPRLQDIKYGVRGYRMPDDE